MKKTIKKLDNNVVKALTLACETAKDWQIGFVWLTHTARYEQFPGSLMVTCVFEHDEDVRKLTIEENDKKLRQLIQQHLLKVGIKVKDIRRHVCFDSEESCEREHNGDWQKRLVHC
ncbi:Fis family transcriptional regulator [uncultured Alteromonas sp.]|jgi:2-polyprenyl-6-methoxyphenol hydroxylase-like FAD-dependent oxidoreductase|uniref:Fis family transcriptional regulator n=1 Tax=uncultured Alteromonas sp. TaxID=179113 RepID=UPI0025F9FC6C|nr:Fis family transcriptional regulator [uncultured Alteromonas sp.]